MSRPDQDFESRVARLLRLKTSEPTTRKTRASGALPQEKGDVLHPYYHVECKHTHNWPITVQWDWWIKCCIEAEDIQKTPCLVLGVGLASTPGRDMIYILETTQPASENWLDTGSKRVHSFKPRTIQWHGEVLTLMLFPPHQNGVVNA